MGTFLSLLVAFAAGAFIAAWFGMPGFRARVHDTTAWMVGAFGALTVMLAKVKGWL